MLTLIIKGDKVAAQAAAAVHGIPITIAAELTKWHETIAVTADCYRLQVGLAWFAQPPHEAPFPDGTLLWYGTREENPPIAYTVGTRQGACHDAA